MEWLWLMAAIFILLYITSPIPKADTTFERYDNFLLAAWMGAKPLFWVFWPFFLLLNLCLYGTDFMAKSGLITVSSWDEIHFILLLSVIWWTISIWRCSSNTQLKLATVLARMATILVFFEYGLKLLIRIDYARLFFNCEEILLDYGSCF
jgi:hypothetical protein